MTLGTATRCVAIAMVGALCFPALAAAQEPVRSFDQLGTQVKPGDTVWVVDLQGRELKGKLRELTGSSLTIDSRGLKTMPAATVQQVRRKTGHRFLWGILIGGAAGAVALALLVGDDWDEGAGWEFPAFAGLGAGAGAGVAALFPAKQRVVYRAQGSPGTANAMRFSVGPILSPRVKGITLRFVF